MCRARTKERHRQTRTAQEKENRRKRRNNRQEFYNGLPQPRCKLAAIVGKIVEQCHLVGRIGMLSAQFVDACMVLVQLGTAVFAGGQMTGPAMRPPAILLRSPEIVKEIPGTVPEYEFIETSIFKLDVAGSGKGPVFVQQTSQV